jgi:tRNA nucleotidyltransferase (CCA-adding enzyme)
VSTDDPADALERFEVGGAVRDALLGRPVSDRDWVVVGSTPQRMVELGFRPVGRDFPVFLHPRTHEEHALARTERKTAPGYRGFVVHCAPEVTIEDDLRRRDLTINAIARRPDGTLVDPCGGERDLRARVLRHVGEAFAEDPVRILRLARFAARFADFEVAPETRAIAATMVAAGEVDALVPERAWQEIARGLAEDHPSRMLSVLRDCGALARLLPGLPGAHEAGGAPVHAGAIVDAAAAAGTPLPVRFAALLLDLGAGDPDDEAAATLALEAAQRLKAPSECRDLAVIAARERRTVQRGDALGAAEMLALLDRTDAVRKPDRFEALLAVCAADRAGRGGRGPDVPRARLERALRAARAVDAGALAAAVRAAPDAGTGPRGGSAPAERIRDAVRQARHSAIESALRACDAPRHT